MREIDQILKEERVNNLGAVLCLNTKITILLWTASNQEIQI